MIRSTSAIPLPSRAAPCSGRLAGRKSKSRRTPAGFSLLETLVAVAIIVLLMSAVFPFLVAAQKRFQGNQMSAEASQSARAALEVMTQEIGQAGFNPNFTSNKTLAAAVPASGVAQCVTLNNAAGGSGDISGINPGDYVSVGSGTSYELIQVLSTSNAYTSSCGSPNQIKAKFLTAHASGSPVISYKLPYGSGLLYNATATTPSTESTDQRLEFFGDINQDGVINYVVYSLNPTTSPATTVSVTTGDYQGTYTMYNLYRSVTQVQYTDIPTPSGYTVPNNKPAYLFVPNVLYDATNKRGPTGEPIFKYPNVVTLGVVPNVITVIGTVQVTVSVAVNPKSLETGVVQWFTMATQIRPLDLSAAINVNNAGGTSYLPLLPPSLPMAFPSNYYQ